MPTKDIVLSLDLSPEDCLYRILREDSSRKRIVYVHLKQLDMIPEGSQTYGPDVIRELSKLKEWFSQWETLVIFQSESCVHVDQDTFKPHSLPPQHILGSYPHFNVLDLTVAYSVKTRVYCVIQDGMEYFMKIARFKFELAWLAQEVKAYHALACHHSLLAPKMLGYVYEESHDRVVGFLFEKISGHRPGIADLELCEVALRELHELDIIHGDLNRDNIFITNKGVKFIDFEDSYVGQAEDADHWKKLKFDEERNLPEKLSDESGKGRPLIDDDV